MDIWHKIARIVKIANIGTVIFFLCNMAVIVALFGGDKEAMLPMALFYIAGVALSLSPVGEWVLCFLAGAEEIKRVDVKLKVVPLLEVVYDKAYKKTPDVPKKVHLKIIHEEYANAYALGYHTICVTDGLLDLPDGEVMGILAHEVGHLRYRHSVLQLLMGGSNIFICGFLLVLKIVSYIFTGLMLLFSIQSRSWAAGIFSLLAGGFFTGAIWLWSRFCLLFLRWSMRQNELVADAYAYELGFGKELASALDVMEASHTNGLLKALYSTHPDKHTRIAKLQQMGVQYSRYAFR
ncbi:MAG: M48 family metalloprotease [Lachnospiraceae bacterium]|nr:M48 family metalloprotease [Lachnospiraceae bacterium]MDD3616815.1 M48 family metalloprotease [Lachnospiraceae bacterium]